MKNTWHFLGFSVVYSDPSAQTNIVGRSVTKVIISLALLVLLNIYVLTNLFFIFTFLFTYLLIIYAFGPALTNVI